MFQAPENQKKTNTKIQMKSRKRKYVEPFHILSQDQDAKEIERLLLLTPNIPISVNDQKDRKGILFDIEGRDYVYAPQYYGALWRFTNRNQMGLYIAHQNSIVAFLMAHDERKLGVIELVSVNPLYAGTGLCQMLVREAARRFKNKGVEKVSIDNAGGLAACICYHKAMQPYYPHLKFHPKYPIADLTPSSKWKDLCEGFLDRIYQYSL
jgi:hypothetical protein